MKRLVIIGASAMGRETCSYARVCGMEVKGFLDSRDGLLDSHVGYPPIIGDVDGYSLEADDVFVCALGEPEQRRAYAAKIVAKGGLFTTIIHPSAVLGENVKIGTGSIIRPMSVIGSDARIGNHVIVGTLSLVAHDCVVGDYSEISPGCHIAGRCTIGEDAFMGIHSAVVPDTTIGRGVFVAAGAVVTKSVESGRVMGVPAVRK